MKQALFSHVTVHLWENTLDGPSLPCRVDNLKLRIITSLEEFDQLLTEGVDLSWYEMSVQQYKERLSEGAILFCGFINEDLVYVSWAGTTEKTHGSFYFFPIDYRYAASIGGTRTAPNLRGKGSHTWATSEIHKFLREKGKSKAVMQIGRDNVAAQKAQIKLGSYIGGEGHQLRLLGVLNFKWVSPYTKKEPHQDGGQRD